MTSNTPFTSAGRRQREEEVKPRSNHDILSDKSTLFKINAWRTAIPTNHYWQPDPDVPNTFTDNSVCAVCGKSVKEVRTTSFDQTVQCPCFDKWGAINNQGDLQNVVLRRMQEQDEKKYKQENDMLKARLEKMEAMLMSSSK